MKKDFSFPGFETISIDSLAEYQADGIHLRHIQTGAEIYKVNVDDEENLFAFIFRTPPFDHTGVPHIMEHAVLCGSQRYPLKDPFLVLLKGSTHTFLNAMTYPDKTVYPASSTVKADFFNLLRVYGDAVFFPNLKKEAFEQEGHRLEIEKNGWLVRSGIVLNEMKGSYSSPESVAEDLTVRSILPDTPYRWDSGGAPKHIPELTYESFINFHETYYQPSNSRIFLYGNHNLEEVLTVLDSEYLSKFQYRKIASQISMQSPWPEPKRMTGYWPCSPDERVQGKSIVSQNWLWGDTTDLKQFLDAQVLSYILLGHSGSPLQQALIDSALGEDLSPISGLDTSLRQMIFTVALRGTDPGKDVEIEKVIFDSLEKSSRKLDDDLVEGALRSVEFRFREISGSMPFGLRLMQRAVRGWLHDKPPGESMSFERPMKNLRENQGKSYFEELIRKSLIDNSHRTTVVLSPSPGLNERREEEDRIHLREVYGKLSPEDLKTLELSSENLKSFQETPDKPEDLARIPFLSPEDLPKKVAEIPLESGTHDLIDWYSHETLTSGISYLEMAFDLEGLSPELQTWMPLFGFALTDVGLPGLPHNEVSRILAMRIGGLNCSLEASPIHKSNGNRISLRLFLHLKALSSQWDEALGITMEILHSADFDNLKRVDDLLIELRNDYRSAIIPSGNAFASMRASAKHSISSSWEDLWYGISQYQFLQSIAQNKERASIASRALKRIRESILQQTNLSLAVTSDFDADSTILNRTLERVSSLPVGSLAPSRMPPLFRHETVAESISTSSAVSYSALSLPAPRTGSPEHAMAVLLAHVLKTGYLWENIRMKGGAYGTSASVSGLEGTFTFSTYRDPLIIPSLTAFRESLEWAAGNLDDDTVKMAIIGSTGRELKPFKPKERGVIAFKRKLYGITDELRQLNRDTQLNATAEDVRKAAEALLDSWGSRSISVIAGDEDLQEASKVNQALNESKITLEIPLPS